MPVTRHDLRRFAVVRSLFTATTLQDALLRFGFVQADPIRAPARAQDLTLRHRVRGYRAGDLERAYSTIDVEEDVFVNYGFLPRAVQALMHPRAVAALPGRRRARAEAVLGFVRERGAVHPRAVDEHFSHGTVRNYWGGASSATTHMLEDLHYRGLLRVARREGGVRIYALQEHAPRPLDAPARRARIDRLVDVVVRIYAPLPAAGLSSVVSRLRYGVPHWRRELKAALARAKERLSHARVDGTEWYWPADEQVAGDPDAAVRLLAPFDPIVWDRRRFEWFWGWAYRFEAYTPAAKRTRGYYALPLLWRDRMVGWANVAVTAGVMRAACGYVDGRAPRERGFEPALQAELHRMRVFLGLDSEQNATASPRRLRR
jgi:uncharacterized protein YcaQ